MLKIYTTNSLVHWTEREIDARDRMLRLFADEVRRFLKAENRAWEVERVEAPTMIPRALINANYSDDDLWVLQPHDAVEEALVMRPETTPSTYAYMVHQLHTQQAVRLPWCVWQAGRSYRAERDHVLSHMRLKEFWQLEFQCAYSADTMNDYQEKCLEPVRRLLASQFAPLPTRLVESDRLPDYSLRTMDVEVELPTTDGQTRWMEVCSISKRKDFPTRFRYQNKKKDWLETEVLVLEIAIGLDRCVHAWSHAQDRL